MDIGWYQVLTVIIANLGVVFWMWREVRSDIKEARSDMKEFRQNIENLRKDFHQESKNFHGRLGNLETKYLKMDRRK